MTVCVMTGDYKVCLVPVTCKLLLNNCGARRLFSAREDKNLLADSKVRSLLHASGVQTFPGDSRIRSLFGASDMKILLMTVEHTNFFRC